MIPIIFDSYKLTNFKVNMESKISFSFKERMSRIKQPVEESQSFTLPSQPRNKIKNLSANLKLRIQARIAQLAAYRLGTRELPGSNPGKVVYFSVKISNWIVQI